MSTQTTLVPTSIPDMLEHIKEIESPREILALIKKIDALKVALEAVDTFHSQSIMYAKLEANALIRAVELGGMTQLRGPHRKTAEWLYGLSEREREKYIFMCDDGVTIDWIYRHEIEKPQKINEKLDAIRAARNSLIQECKEKGIVDITPFQKMVKESLPYDKQDICHDVVDGARNRLKKAGAVGIGDDTGIYVMPCPENSEEIKKAITLRYESICADYERIKQIAKASGVTVSYRELNDGSDWAYHNHVYIIYTLMALIDMHVISDAKDCVAAIDRTWTSEEISNVKKCLGLHVLNI